MRHDKAICKTVRLPSNEQTIICYTTTTEKYKLVREEVLGEGGGWCGEGGGGKQRMTDGL